MNSKKILSRILTFIFIVAILLSGYFYKNFYKRQINKVISYYLVWQGDKYYKKRKIHKAIEIYQNAIYHNPKHYRALYNLGNIFVMYEDYFSAMDSYIKALDINPNYQVARINYAILLANSSYDYDKAIEEYNKAINITKPKWINYIKCLNKKTTFDYNKGIALYNLGLAWRGKSLAIEEENPLHYQYINNSKESYKKALEYVQNYNVYYNLALANHLLSNSEEAGEYYCKAIQESPLDYEAHYNLAMLLKSLKRNRESIDEFKKAGLILDIKGDNDKTRYIYDVLNDTMHYVILNDGYNYIVKHIEEENEAFKSEVTYVGGKIVLADELDKAMIKNFEKCVFLNKINEEEEEEKKDAD